MEGLLGAPEAREPLLAVLWVRTLPRWRVREEKESWRNVAARPVLLSLLSDPARAEPPTAIPPAEGVAAPLLLPLPSTREVP
jgi:hypothetical protein